MKTREKIRATLGVLSDAGSILTPILLLTILLASNFNIQNMLPGQLNCHTAQIQNVSILQAWNLNPAQQSREPQWLYNAQPGTNQIEVIAPNIEAFWLDKEHNTLGQSLAVGYSPNTSTVYLNNCTTTSRTMILRPHQL